MVEIIEVITTLLEMGKIKASIYKIIITIITVIAEKMTSLRSITSKHSLEYRIRLVFSLQQCLKPKFTKMCENFPK